MFRVILMGFLHHRLRLMHHTQFPQRVSDRSVVLAVSCSTVISLNLIMTLHVIIMREENMVVEILVILNYLTSC